MKKFSKKGFSLVELIIVVSIMAIMVGFMAPQLIKYIEKTRVSSDVQIADTIRSSLFAAITDARVISDPASQPYLDAMESATGFSLTNPTPAWDGTSVLQESLNDALGTSDFSELIDALRSKHGAVDIRVYTANNQTKVVIEQTDFNGRGDYSDSNNWITVD